MQIVELFGEDLLRHELEKQKAMVEKLQAALGMVIDNVRTGSYESTGQAIDEAEKLLPHIRAE